MPMSPEYFEHEMQELRERADAADVALDKQQMWWKTLGNLLNTGGMADPAFIVGQVEALCDLKVAAEAAGTQLRQDLRALPRYSVWLSDIGGTVPGRVNPAMKVAEDVNGEWIKWRDLADRLARRAPQLQEKKEDHDEKKS